MTRYIDADALKEWLQILPNASYTDMVLNTIDDLPTIDAVPVIRCKDCKHYTGYECQRSKVSNIRVITNDDDYCSRAERKESS